MVEISQIKMMYVRSYKMWVENEESGVIEVIKEFKL